MKVIIGIATRGTDIHYSLIAYLLNLQKQSKHDIHIILAQCSISPYIAQMTLLENALKETFDYFFFIDSDVCPPDGAIDKIIEINGDIVTIPVWHYDENTQEVHLNASINGSRIYSYGKGIEQIIHTSFACVGIKKSVFDKFIQHKQNPLKWDNTLVHELKNVGSDTIFFRKCARLEIPVYINWDIRGAIHYKTIALSDKVINDIQTNINK